MRVGPRKGSNFQMFIEPLSFKANPTQRIFLERCRKNRHRIQRVRDQRLGEDVGELLQESLDLPSESEQILDLGAFWGCVG